MAKVIVVSTIGDLVSVHSLHFSLVQNIEDRKDKRCWLLCREQKRYKTSKIESAERYSGLTNS